MKNKVNNSLYQIVIHTFIYYYRGDGDFDDLEATNFTVDELIFESESKLKEYLNGENEDEDFDRELLDDEEYLQDQDGKELNDFPADSDDYEMGDGDWDNLEVFETYEEANLFLENEYIIAYKKKNSSLVKNGERKNGQKIGLWKSFDNDGKLESEGNFKVGKKDGLWKFYFNNGKLKKSAFFLNDQINGLEKSFYVNGNIQQEGYWKDGKCDGLWKYYDNNSNLEQEGHWEKGIQVGVWKDYYSNGELKQEGEIKNEIKFGLWKFYDSNGKLEKEADSKEIYNEEISNLNALLNKYLESEQFEKVHIIKRKINRLLEKLE